MSPSSRQPDGGTYVVPMAGSRVKSSSTAYPNDRLSKRRVRSLSPEDDPVWVGQSREFRLRSFGVALLPSPPRPYQPGSQLSTAARVKGFRHVAARAGIVPFGHDSRGP